MFACKWFIPECTFIQRSTVAAVREPGGQSPGPAHLVTQKGPHAKEKIHSETFEYTLYGGPSLSLNFFEKNVKE